MAKGAALVDDLIAVAVQVDAMRHCLHGAGEHELKGIRAELDAAWRASARAVVLAFEAEKAEGGVCGSAGYGGR